MTYSESLSANERSTRPAAHMPLSRAILNYSPSNVRFIDSPGTRTLDFRGPF